MNRSQPPPRRLQRTALLLLACWTGLGLLHTGYVMVRPHGLIIRRPPELARTIGLPGADDGRTVITALDLIVDAEIPSTSPILVVRPTDAELPFWDYVHFQLAQLAYPRRIDLIANGSTPPLDPTSYAAVLAPPGITVGGWAPRLPGTELVLHGRLGEP